MTKLSVIVPVYNVEVYLPVCIKSILNQSLRDFELILIDDGSPDNCGGICDQFAAEDPRIHVIHQKNAGVSAARNAGLRIANGEYIGFVDPDDWIDPIMYEQMILAIEKNSAQLAICGYNYYDEDGHVDESRLYQIRNHECIDRRELMRRMSDMPPTLRHGVVNKLFSRQLLQGQHFIQGLHSSEDVCFLTEYLPKVQAAVIVHQPFYRNLVRQGSATHGGLSIDSLADSFQAHRNMFDTIVTTFPELLKHSQAFYLDICLLKYNEAQRKAKLLPYEEREPARNRLSQMRSSIHKEAWRALLNEEIYWKTRICYLLTR